MTNGFISSIGYFFYSKLLYTACAVNFILMESSIDFDTEERVVHYILRGRVLKFLNFIEQLSLKVQRVQTLTWCKVQPCQRTDLQYKKGK